MKEQHIFEIKISCNIINVFIVAFDQFKATLLNKSINCFKNNNNNNNNNKNHTRTKESISILHNCCICFIVFLLGFKLTCLSQN